MTWPFENDTSTVVKKLAKRNLTADKTRNILIVMTIAFAACLIMATALYAIGTQRASRNYAAGMYQANISGLDDETARAIQNDERVLAGFSFFLGMLDHGEYKVTVHSMDENLIRLAKYPALNGRLPESENEVAVTQAFLDREGLTVQVGDTIPLALTGARQHYTVCGIGGDLAGAPALLQTVLRDAPVGLHGGTVIVADGNTQHETIHLPYYDGILYYGGPILASGHQPTCNQMLSECHEMFCDGHFEIPKIKSTRGWGHRSCWLHR